MPFLDISNRQNPTICGKLLSFSKMFCGSFISAVCCFLLKNKIAVYRQTHCVIIHWLVIIWKFSVWQLWIILLLTYMIQSLYGHVFSFLRGRYLEVEMQSCRVSLCLIFKETTKLFFKVTAVWGSNLYISSPALVTMSFSIIAMLLGVMWF